MTVSVIIPAAGSSTRMGDGKKKEFLPLCSSLFPEEKNGTVISCVIEAFLQAFQSTQDFLISNLIIATQLSNKDEATKAIFSSNKVSTLCKELNITPTFVQGGKTRQESILNCFEFLNSNKITTDLVCIHDGARPWILPKLILEVLTLAKEKESAAPIISCVDTLKEIDKTNNTITQHLTREKLGAIQTPQCFAFEQLYSSYKKAQSDSFECTDDTEIWTKYTQKKVYFCTGNPENKKITYHNDIENNSKSFNSRGELPMVRIGLGYDLHKLIPERKLMLGGISIPSVIGEDGHSDGDVLLHSITDALLGAACLGDIGEFFPPSDSKWKNADSKDLLTIAWNKIKEEGWQLGNLDCVINLEKPKLLAYREKIRESIASLLNCNLNQIFVKAKTGEQIGEVGTNQAVAVWSSCFLIKY